jgi:hypothetical protein
MRSACSQGAGVAQAVWRFLEQPGRAGDRPSRLGRSFSSTHLTAYRSPPSTLILPDPEPFERMRALRLAAARIRAQAELAGAAEEELADAEADAQAAMTEWANAGGRGDPPANRLERLRQARLKSVRHRLSSDAHRRASDELQQAERGLADAKREHLYAARALVTALARPQIAQLLQDAETLRARFLSMQGFATEHQRERARSLAWEPDPDGMKRIWDTPSVMMEREWVAARDARDNPTVSPEWQERIDRLIQDPEADIS